MVDNPDIASKKASVYEMENGAKTNGTAAKEQTKSHDSVVARYICAVVGFLYISLKARTNNIPQNIVTPDDDAKEKAKSGRPCT